MTLVQTTKKNIKLDKPLSSGFMVLENAKYIMYDFWYNTLKPKYGSKIKLLLSDTDSFIYGVYTEDVYKDLHDMRNLMDLSGYEKDTVLGKLSDKSNKKVPDKFSDEKPLEIIKEVVANKPKMYSIITKKIFCLNKDKIADHLCDENCQNGHSATAKGVPRVAKQKIAHQDYKDVLLTSGTSMVSAQSIRTINNSLYSIKTTKRGLSAYDDKKYILDDKISTLSYGHYKLV